MQRVTREYLVKQAREAELNQDWEKAVALYGHIFKQEICLNGLTEAARNQIRCFFRQTKGLEP